MIGYVINQNGLNADYQFYNESLPFIFLNEEKANEFLTSLKMTLRLSFLIEDSPKYEKMSYSHFTDENEELLISQIKNDLVPLLTNEEQEISKPRFVGDSSIKKDQDDHLIKINEWKKSQFALRRKYLDSYQDVIDFYNSGGQFIWNEIIDLTRSGHKNDISFSVEEYEIIE